MESCWETLGEFDGNSYELFGKPSAIHGKLLGNAWGLFLGNSFVRKGPTRGRTHPHACKIPYKAAVPVLCPHRFIVECLFDYLFVPFFSVVFWRCFDFMCNAFWPHFGASLFLIDFGGSLARIVRPSDLENRALAYTRRSCSWNRMFRFGRDFWWNCCATQLPQWQQNWF